MAVAAPLDCGVKVTVKDALCPAFKVSGRESPLIVNSEVLPPAFERVMLDPLAVSEAVRLLLCPTVTLPKLKLAGLTASCPATVAVPARVMLSVELEASDVTAIDPLALPPIVGAKTVPKVKLWPGLSVMGRLSPVAMKPVPETLA